MSYIKELPYVNGVEDVVFVAPRVMYADRADMGWSQDMLGKYGGEIKFHIAPQHDEIRKIYEHYQGEDTVCLYSGINDFPELTEWMKIGLAYNIKRGIVTERPNVYWNKPLWLHKLRFLLRSQKYVRHFDYVFGIGDSALEYYATFSRRWKLLPWGYCTEKKDAHKVDMPSSGDLRMVFVGTINKNKNVISVLRSMVKSNKAMRLDVIGDGPEKDNIQHFITTNKLTQSVCLHGYKTMDEVYSMLPDYDVLVLPSKYDGWGAVVNEGLQAGLFVICSNACGAQSLLKDSRIGMSFSHEKELAALLDKCAINIGEIRANKEKRRMWSECISGKTMAEYMVKNLMNESSYPALWERNMQ